MWPNPQETTTQEILNEKLHFLCSDYCLYRLAGLTFSDILPKLLLLLNKSIWKFIPEFRIQNPGQNIWNKVKKSSKIGLEQKTMITFN